MLIQIVEEVALANPSPVPNTAVSAVLPEASEVGEQDPTHLLDLQLQDIIRVRY
jgi:hypothetical protein